MARASTEALLYFPGQLNEGTCMSSTRRKTTCNSTIQANSNRVSVLSSHLGHFHNPIHSIHLSTSAFTGPSSARVCCCRVVEYANHVERDTSMTSVIQTKSTLSTHSRLYLTFSFCVCFHQRLSLADSIPSAPVACIMFMSCWKLQDAVDGSGPCHYKKRRYSFRKIFSETYMLVILF